MKININEIPRDGLLLEETQTGEALDIERSDLEFNQPVEIKAEIKREFDTVYIHMEINSRMKFSCGRCLAAGFKNIAKKIDTTLAIDEENIIDLTQIAREEIILDYPSVLLCSKDCRGLCVKCGKNLNQGQCLCDQSDSSIGVFDINN